MINPNTYLKFLSRNKLYTFVSVAGFSISLMFVIILGLYVTQELSVDDFHKNRDRIFMLADGTTSILGNPVPQFVKDNCPEVESFVRVLSRETAVGKRGDDKLRVKALFVDSTFFRVFSYKVLEGDPARVLEAHKTAVVTRSFAARYFGNEDPVGKTLFIDNGEHTVTGIAENMPENTIMPDAEIFVNYHSITQYWGDWVMNTSHNFGFTAFFLAKEGADFRSKAPALFDLFKENFWYFQHGFGKSLQIISLKEAYFTLTASGYGFLKYNSRTTITIYLAIAVLILVIALLNYINLTVAQAGFRGRESAIKKLLGGSKAGLISQLLAESLLITAVTFL
ncbi:MAG: ABC transporter permease, partial [Prevotellaceae bacterium]|nr:ABC transporter permease [Prevotellaceae bacterium]